MYIVVILLGTSVGATTSAEAFLNVDTLKIVVLGLVAFAVGTAAGVLSVSYTHLDVYKRQALALRQDLLEQLKQ